MGATFKEWRMFASCDEQDTDMFFNPGGGVPQIVREMCEDCLVSRECLREALHLDVYGVWAGTTRAQRKRMQKEQGIIPEPVTVGWAGYTGQASSDLESTLPAQWSWLDEA